MWEHLYSTCRKYSPPEKPEIENQPYRHCAGVLAHYFHRGAPQDARATLRVAQRRVLAVGLAGREPSPPLLVELRREPGETMDERDDIDKERRWMPMREMPERRTSGEE